MAGRDGEGRKFCFCQISTAIFVIALDLTDLLFKLVATNPNAAV